MIEIIYSNFGFWINLLIPFVVALYLVIAHKEYVLKEFGVQVGVTFVYLSAVFYFLFNTMTDLKDTEYWNGNVKEFVYFEEWTEEEEYTESYDCGKSERCTKTIKRDVYHPPQYKILTSNDESISISKKEYKDAKYKFGDKKKYISRPNQVSKGDGEKYICKPNILIPTTVEHEYINYVTAAKSNVIHTKVSPQDIAIMEKEAKLSTYPKLYTDKYGTTKLFRVIDDTNLSNKKVLTKELDMFSAINGKRKQVNPIIYITNQDRTFKAYLEAYWNKGKKNDVTLILGVDKKGKVLWSDVIAWTNNTDFIVDCQNSFKGMNVSKEAKKITQKLAELIVSGYERKPMKEFEYLKENITIEWYWQLLVVLGNIVLSFFITRYFLNNYNNRIV
jgi:hypothetical protein